MRTARTAVLASATALALALTACGGDDDGGGGEEQQTGGGSFSVYNTAPQNPLLPGDTNETEGGLITDAMFTGLVRYNSDTYAAEMNGVAESIESEDQQTWTIKLKDGWTFHDGSPVTAQSFVDAWNHTAYGPNAQNNSYFFANIEGYDDVQGVVETDEETGEVTVVEEPKAETLSGLEVVDDLTFTVKLTAPFSIFPSTVGYTAFYPMAEACLEDIETCGEQPIGNGPWKADGPYVPGEGITLSKFEEYAGENEAHADQVEIREYADADTGYNDLLAGNVDITDTLPQSAFATAADELGDRYEENPEGDITMLGFPLYLEEFQDKRVRQAFSMAIDRQAISEQIFQGSETPASSFTSPVVDGYREGACGANVEFDAAAAKDLLAQTDYPLDKTLHIWFNTGAGHEEWVEAVANQLTQNLGIKDYKLDGIPFDQLLNVREQKKLTGPFRHGWVMDYPHVQNFLEPLFTIAALPPAGSNEVIYENPDFDALIAEANQLPDPDEALAKYQEAEDILCEDLPAIPLFHGVVRAARSENVDNVVVNAFSRIELWQVDVVNP